MCFSANASFASAVILSVVGITSIRRTTSSSQLAFGAVPFVFAIQQLSEGFVWLSVTDPFFVGWQGVSIYTFLIFAHIVWPTWIPLSILMLEKNEQRKKILRVLLGIGMLLSFSYASCLIIYPVTAEAAGYHIQYRLNYPVVFLETGSAFYGLATVLPEFISSVRRMRWLGLFIALSYVVTYIFYQQYIISVWCYFAALISVIIYWVLKGVNQFYITGRFTNFKIRRI
ncbi:hypothetical protein LK994_09480 [Ferruginibacter lapsinanis]|uniref:DUF6629 family protein n=1 Tax=Ferruginibacter lapsinanis TaxID=563172 RepID=UPI001E607A2A|nr:DUF6629 family protein [Ferruginibacter lapsinanis]UEG48867.1 hypothetical protein LK994_09480 [Ferruginibacter lapsinanis]